MNAGHECHSKKNESSTTVALGLPVMKYVLLECVYVVGS